MKQIRGESPQLVAKNTQGFVSNRNNFLAIFAILQQLWSTLSLRWAPSVAFPASRAVEDHGAKRLSGFSTAQSFQDV
jgi:hypothetical protein